MSEADPKNSEAAPDGRLFSPTFERNSAPIIAALQTLSPPAAGNALEIGSGSGQQICAFATAFPEMSWIASEPDADNRASIQAWSRFETTPLTAILDIDARADWATAPALAPHLPLGLVISLNVIHISPVSVTHGIIAGAAKTLAAGGLLAFYGPFKEGGVHTGDGNVQFDRHLRDRNPEWGIRDIDDLTAIASGHGFDLPTLVQMPANNRILAFRRF